MKQYDSGIKYTEESIKIIESYITDYSNSSKKSQYWMKEFNG